MQKGSALTSQREPSVFTLHVFGHVCPQPPGGSLRSASDLRNATQCNAAPAARPSARRRPGREEAPPGERSAPGLRSPPGGASSRRWRSRDGSASAAAVTWARVEGHGAAMELSAYAQGGCRLLGDPRRLSRRAYAALLRAAFRGVLQPRGGVGERERAAGRCVGAAGPPACRVPGVGARVCVRSGCPCVPACVRGWGCPCTEASVHARRRMCT